jgi:transposase InsO family protein
VITPQRRYSADEKENLLAIVTRAQELCPDKSLEVILSDLGLPSATYHRWCGRAAEDHLADRIVVPHHEAIPPTPAEVACVRTYVEQHHGLGYKRLAYSLMLENKAFVYPWMVHDILAQADLLGRRQPLPERLHRPPEADHPDQRWHTDLMMWYFSEQWYWLLDVLDAYSRYLVYCEVLITATAQDVARAEQRAIETLAGRPRRAGEPAIVHDGGPQFIGREWKQFVQAVGMTNVRTHPYHPQSNGKDERVHRTLREEVPLDEDANLYGARTVIRTYRQYYNEHRPHSALQYVCPHDYYRGDPTLCLQERQTKLREAAEVRRAYWDTHRPAVRSTS